MLHGNFFEQRKLNGKVKHAANLFSCSNYNNRSLQHLDSKLLATSAVNKAATRKVINTTALDDKGYQGLIQIVNEEEEGDAAPLQSALRKNKSQVILTALLHRQQENGWQDSFSHMHSRHNSAMHKDKREFFDRPVQVS